MLRFRKPTRATVEAFREAQTTSTFSYAEVGASNRIPPAGYTIDRYRVRLGEGQQVFERAQQAVDRWEMFDIGWVTMFAESSFPGTTVAVLVRLPGMYSVDAGRVVYRFDEPGPIRRYGFGYGTLHAHAEQGEERFTVEWDRASNEVWYDVVSFSRPRARLARLAYPLTRFLQRRFARDSKKAMVRAVGRPKRSAMTDPQGKNSPPAARAHT